MVLLFLYVGGALAISFLCSILEASLLSVSAVELTERKSRGDRGAALLLELKHERIDDAIGAILTLNTFAHTIGAALAGAQAAAVFGDAWVGAFSAVLTLLVLIFTEIIPKTLGTVYASRLAGFTARVTDLLTRLLRYPLAALRLLTRPFAPAGHRPRISRREVAALAHSAAQEGSLDEEISRAVTNILRLREVRVCDVMTPRTVAVMLPAETTLGGFLAIPSEDETRVFSRIPIHRETRDDVEGYILQREVLAAAAAGAPPETPLARFARPALILFEKSPVEEVLKRMIRGREHLALVADEFGGISGLVTLEDLVETAFGVEILDETDQIADLRAEAHELRRRRLAAGL